MPCLRSPAGLLTGSTIIRGREGTVPPNLDYRGSARIFAWYGVGEDDTFTCRCGWTGTFMAMSREMYEALVDGSCPQCDTMLVIRQYPSESETRSAAAAGNPEAIAELGAIEARNQGTLTTHGGPTAEKEASLFVNEVLEGALAEVELIDRANSWEQPAEDGESPPPPDARTKALALARRILPMPTKRERRLALRLRAAELVGLLEGTDPADAETRSARAQLAAELAGVGERAAIDADAARAMGLDPITFREIAVDGAGAKLLDILPLPERFSYSAFNTYDTCPLRLWRSGARPSGRRADLRLDRARRLRGIHEGAPRATGPRR